VAGVTDGVLEKPLRILAVFEGPPNVLTGDRNMVV
jgi:hypothetical protein